MYIIKILTKLLLILIAVSALTVKAFSQEQIDDIEVIGIDATKEAASMKNTKIMNMIMLGGFLKKKPIIEISNILEGLKQVLPERYHHLLPLNEQALRRGMEMVEEASQSVKR